MKNNIQNFIRELGQQVLADVISSVLAGIILHL